MSVRVLLCCLTLAAAGPLAFAQQPQAGRKSRGAEAAEVVTPKGSREQMRAEMQARMLEGLSDKIKEMDEPAMRAFLRLRVVTYLWAQPESEKLKAMAERMAVEGLKDCEEHKDEFPARLKGWLPRDLLTQLQIHAPKLAQRLAEEYKIGGEGGEDGFDRAFSLLSAEGQATKASEALRRGLNGGQDPGITLSFFVDQLQGKQPDAVPKLLDAILTLAEQKPGSLSFNTLYWLSRFYMGELSAAALKARYVAVILDSAADAESWPDAGQVAQAFALLSDLLPATEKIAPPLYARAAARVSALRPLAQGQLRMRELEERARLSQDPLEFWKAEAERPENRDIRNDLLCVAAQLALGEKQLKGAVDLIAKLSIRGHDGPLALWHDQFLGEVVGVALKEKDAETANLAAAEILAPLKRAAALQRVAVYHLEANDLIKTRQELGDAIKLIDSAEDNAAKAIAYLNLSAVYLKADSLKVPEVLKSAVRVVNGLRRPDVSDSRAREAYVDNLSFIAYNVIPAFQAVARSNDSEALLILDKIDLREIKASAEFGICLGLGPDDKPGEAAANN